MRYRGLIFLLSIFLLAATCERAIDLDLGNQQPRLVVISNFTTTQDLRVQVSATQTVLEPADIDFILNADVGLYIKDQLLEELELVRPTNGVPYFTTRDFHPEPGIKYTIKVSADGYESVTAMSTIPPKTEIQSLTANGFQIQDIPKSSKVVYNFTVELSFEDPQNMQNYYHLKLFQQFQPYKVVNGDTITQRKALRELVFNPGLNNNYQVAHIEGGVLLEDTPFNGSLQHYKIPLQVETGGPPELPGKVIAELRTVSEEYYLFYSSISRQQSAPDQPLSEPVSIFNNVTNGQGVFAGYAHSIDSVAIRQY